MEICFQFAIQFKSIEKSSCAQKCAIDMDIYKEKKRESTRIYAVALLIYFALGAQSEQML